MGESERADGALTFTAYGLADFTVQDLDRDGVAGGAGRGVRDNTLVWRSLTFAAVTTTKIRVLAERGRMRSAAWWKSKRMPGAAWRRGRGHANVPPVVTLTSPANGATLTAPATVALGATASDPDGTVRDVTFYANGSARSAPTPRVPYSGTWSGVAAGTYTITAVATDTAGAATTSAAAQITVTRDDAPARRRARECGAGGQWRDGDGVIDLWTGVSGERDQQRRPARRRLGARAARGWMRRRMPFPTGWR